MAIPLSCEACDASLKVGDQLAGKKIKCPKCAAIIKVPSEADEEEPETRTRAGSPKAKARKADRDQYEERVRPAARKRRTAEEDEEDEREDEDREEDEEEEDDDEPRMSHKKKVAYMIKDLKRRGVGQSTSAPPFFQLLWAVGIKIPPPLFLGFVPLMLLIGIFGGVGWGGVMWLIQWQGTDMPVWMAFAGAACFGVFFGSTMAFLARRKAKQLRLPPWSKYPKRKK